MERSDEVCPSGKDGVDAQLGARPQGRAQGSVRGSARNRGQFGFVFSKPNWGAPAMDGGGVPRRETSPTFPTFLQGLYPSNPQRSEKTKKFCKIFPKFLPILPRRLGKTKIFSTTFVVHTIYRGIKSKGYIRYIPKRNLVDRRCGKYLGKMCRAKMSCTFFVQFVMHHFRAC